MLEALIAEFTTASPVPPGIMILRVIGAVLFCGVIGLEREFRKNAAGLRTNMLIGLAAVVFTLVTLHMLETMGGNQDATRLDPVRLVEAVTAGIAFLAAGVIVYARGDVHGLTTGASMWLSAAIGLSVGLGMWSVALAATVVGIVILWLLRKTEVAVGMKDENE